MTRCSPARHPGRRTSDEVLDRVLPEPPVGDDELQPPASPSGVDPRRQTLLDSMGSADRESW